MIADSRVVINFFLGVTWVGVFLLECIRFLPCSKPSSSGELPRSTIALSTVRIIFHNIS